MVRYAIISSDSFNDRFCEPTLTTTIKCLQIAFSCHYHLHVCMCVVLLYNTKLYAIIKLRVNYTETNSFLVYNTVAKVTVKISSNIF